MDTVFWWIGAGVAASGVFCMAAFVICVFIWLGIGLLSEYGDRAWNAGKNFRAFARWVEHGQPVIKPGGDGSQQWVMSKPTAKRSQTMEAN